MTQQYRKKLIEVALPLEDINREAAREKSIRHGHPSTLHLWWARRPLAACRAMLFASLIEDPSECVEELLADPAKRRAAEKLLESQKAVWDERTKLAHKAGSAGIAAPPAGLEPKLEDVAAGIERERLFDIIRELVKWDNSNNETVLQAARKEILRSTNGNPPPVYDPFCGGGSIPLEAQRLGLEAHASDLNPVPVLITKALIEIPPKFAGRPPINPESKKKLSASGSWKGAEGLAEDIRYYGKWMRDEAEKRIGKLYPKVKLPKEYGGGEATVIAWLWARTVASPNPAAKGAHVPLVRSFWLSSKAGKKTWVKAVIDKSIMTYDFEVRTGIGEPHAGTVSRTGAVCLLTGSPMPLEYIRAEGREGRLGARMLAMVCEGPKGRMYVSPTHAHEAAATAVSAPDDLPETHLPERALGFRVQAYGMTRHRDLFTNRQLVMLSTCCALVGEARSMILKSSNQDQSYADAIATYLAFGISKAADRNTTLCSWESKMDRMRNTFGRQALPMVWDYAETNPLAGAGGDIYGTIDSLCEALERLITSPAGHVRQRDAAAQESDSSLALFSTDPPYYDNIGYA